jgi:hypothetical protein
MVNALLLAVPLATKIPCVSLNCTTLPACFPLIVSCVKQGEPLNTMLPVSLPCESSVRFAVKVSVPLLEAVLPDHCELSTSGTKLAEKFPWSPTSQLPLMVYVPLIVTPSVLALVVIVSGPPLSTIVRSTACLSTVPVNVPLSAHGVPLKNTVEEAKLAPFCTIKKFEIETRRP